MNLKLFSLKIDTLLKNNAVLLAVVIVLTVLLAIFGWELAMAKRETILVPPELNKAVKIGYASADADYYKSWGLYVAELVGNLTPGNAPFVADNLGRLFDAASYQKVKQAVLSSAKEEAEEQANFVFDAQNVIWQPVNDTVFVQGLLYQINPEGQMVSKQKYTFQMSVHIQAGRPVLGGFEPYVGSPHTVAWNLKHLPKKESK
ncbi:type IV conjugative transfer system protein TraE [Acidithiobacillus ferriphilus]|uniref:type IV conjugative transfer system protein TraE n=1 Tax=Acidithiobacillus ferriphilus TaxID=1689834 RepID=UPI002DB84367|nr:type IV conjugative transfer system protein TraE [Acidithiobacillus ferriphilus]MEB8475613.1 type IV conjugative transfer system protein TraE [Acidithiobacillus ferriphilus]